MPSHGQHETDRPLRDTSPSVRSPSVRRRGAGRLGRGRADEPVDDHDRGLAFDLGTLFDRRRALRMFAGGTLLASAGLAGCAGSAGSAGTSGAATSTSTATSTAAATGTGTGTGTDASDTASDTGTSDRIPEETAGPYPGDGSNGPDVLTQSGIVRRDIRSSFGSASAVATGVALTIVLTVRDTSKDGAVYPGAAVYLWHCDSQGRYSLYSDGITGENYLRGVQVADAAGTVTFTTIFPGAYTGRWPHVHFEVYPSLATATSSGSPTATSQLALPEDACTTVYATSGYDGSATNMAQTSLARDMVFGDGYTSQLAAVTGSVTAGYTARLAVPV